MTRSDATPPLMLSVSGARGLVDSTMTPDVAGAFAAAFGSELLEMASEKPLRLVIGRDGRASGAKISEAVCEALAGIGAEVVNVDVATTPTVGIMIRKTGSNGGIVITASHNPIEWNGIKCLDHDGLAPPPELANRIIERFKKGDVVASTADARGSVTRDDSSTRHHVDMVLAELDVEMIRSNPTTVVLDSINSSGSVGGKMLLDDLGCGLIHLNGEQTGDFAHTPEPTRENLRDLARLVAESPEALCGFAQDPDADRLAVVDERGEYIGEEFTLVLAVLRHLQKNGPCDLVANLSTSRMIDDLATRFPGTRVHRSAVGEANVVAKMRDTEAPLGGEGNGGVILRSIGWIRDSFVAMGLVLELLAAEKRALSSIIEELPRYAMIKEKLDLSAIGGRSVIEPALEKLKTAFTDERVNDIDGVRIDFEEGWVHVRASNTEPIMRVIAEAETEDQARSLIHRASTAAGLS
ncbi:MAG: phosphoglucosamine mutase [Planctomycetaceae bacterium]|nr:phosphoglucosamine mutase [Planctomycetaceae bacterium]